MTVIDLKFDFDTYVAKVCEDDEAQELEYRIAAVLGEYLGYLERHGLSDCWVVVQDGESGCGFSLAIRKDPVPELLPG